MMVMSATLLDTALCNFYAYKSLHDAAPLSTSRLCRCFLGERHEWYKACWRLKTGIVINEPRGSLVPHRNHRRRDVKTSSDKSRGIGRYSREGIVALAIVGAVILYMLWLFIGGFTESP